MLTMSRSSCCICVLHVLVLPQLAAVVGMMGDVSHGDVQHLVLQHCHGCGQGFYRRCKAENHRRVDIHLKGLLLSGEVSEDKS